MIKLLIAVTVLAAACGAWLLGAPGKPRAWSECQAPTDLQPVRRYIFRQRAQENARKLYSIRADVYGFPARLSANAHNLVEAASGFAWWINGRPVFKPNYPTSAQNHAGAGMRELFLEIEVASGLGVARCTIAELIPDRDADSLETATTKLQTLIRLLDGERPH